MVVVGSHHTSLPPDRSAGARPCITFRAGRKTGKESIQSSQGTVGPSGRQPGAIFQQEGRERRTPSDGAPIYQGSFEEYHIPAT